MISRTFNGLESVKCRAEDESDKPVLASEKGGEN